MTRIMIALLSVMLLSACLGPEGHNGCDPQGNCAGSDSAGTIWHELTNDIHRTDAAAPDKIGTAPSASNPFPERSTWKDFENRIGNQTTDGAYKTQGPAATKAKQSTSPLIPN